MSFDSKRVVFARAIDRSEKKLVRLKRYDGLRRERLIFLHSMLSRQPSNTGLPFELFDQFMESNLFFSFGSKVVGR